MSTGLIFSNAEIKVFELLGSGDIPRINAMLELYARFFPEYAHYTARMQRRAKLPSESRRGHRVHYWLIEYKDTPVGIFMFRYILPRKCGLGTALALDPSVRAVSVDGKPLTAFMFGKVLAQLEKDALAMGSMECFGMVSEIEHLGLMKRFEKFGMVELPLQYFEPIFPPKAEELPEEEMLSKISFIPAHFCILPHPNSSNREYSPKTVKEFALAFLVDHYNLDEDHYKVQEVLESIA